MRRAERASGRQNKHFHSDINTFLTHKSLLRGTVGGGVGTEQIKLWNKVQQLSAATAVHESTQEPTNNWQLAGRLSEEDN